MIYRLNREISWQEMKDYVYIVNENTNKIYFLRSLSKEVWLDIYKNQPVNWTFLCERYSKKVGKEILLQFINELIERRLLYGSGELQFFNGK